jgi:hypothetical protein
MLMSITAAHVTIVLLTAAVGGKLNFNASKIGWTTSDHKEHKT